MANKCHKCKSELKKVVFDVGYGVNVESLHCERCGNLYFNTVQKIKIFTPDESKPEYKQLIPQPLLQCEKCKHVMELS